MALLSFEACTSNSTKSKVQNIVAKTDNVPVLADMNVENLNHEMVSVAEEVAKHKVTVIDFWASWCAPCLNEMPNMVALYANQKDNGLGIIGISLDNDYDKWQEAVERFGMEWLQLSELRGWESTPARQNGVNSIPYTIVVDSKMRILATDLRGEELAAFVIEQLK